MNDVPETASLRPLSMDVVSVQSQVIYGRVGNNVAVPVLQDLGWTVAAVPTVLLSNTPHYPTLHGGRVPVEWFQGFLQDLQERGALDDLRAVVIGYLGHADQARALAPWLRERLAAHGDLRIVMDPVLGDLDHGLYVEPGLVEAQRRWLLPLADGLTPNGFELACLTGMPVDDVDQVVAAARTLLTGRTRWVAVTSAAPATWGRDEIQVVLVTRQRAEVIRHPRLEAMPRGTGDLFCAALTGHWLNGLDIGEATARACGQVVRAVRRVQQAGTAELLWSPMGDDDGRQRHSGQDYVRHFIYRTHREESSCHPSRPI